MGVQWSENAGSSPAGRKAAGAGVLGAIGVQFPGPHTHDTKEAGDAKS